MIEVSLFILSFFIIFIIDKFKLKISTYTKLIDKPDQIRKFHKDETPLLGGVMIFIPFFLSNLYLILSQKSDDISLIILLMSACCFLIGLIDDIKNIAYRYKFILLIIIFYFFLFLNPELQIDKIYFSSNNKIYSIDKFGIHFTVLCLLLLINALNFF